MIAPLAAGLFQILLGGNDDPRPIATATTTTRPPDLPWIDPLEGGAQLVGATPCPATDGTAVRTTRFETAPLMCISESSTHELTFSTDKGSFTLPVDAALAPEAANLAITFAHYRTYEGIPVVTFTDGGMLWIGGDGDTGFTIPGQIEQGDDPYPVGSVVLVADLDGGLGGVIVVVLDEVTSSLLAADPRHVVIGHIDDLSDIQAITDDLGELEVLVTGVTASETG